MLRSFRCICVPDYCVAFSFYIWDMIDKSILSIMKLDVMCNSKYCVGYVIAI